MVGSTALRSRLGDEVADQLRRIHDDELADVAGQHIGRLVKGTGDGLIFTFDTVSDALDTAVAMQTVMARLRRRRHEQPPIRIGISTGDVAWEDGDCFGMPVVEAARLCDLAEPSQILCSPGVAYLAHQHAASLASLGVRQLKGIEQPMELFEVAWRPTSAGDQRSRTLPFVGRLAEVDTIGAGLTSLAGGTGRIVMVSGEPGVGKSRLVRHATAQTSPEVSYTVLTGRCSEHEVVPYAPWSEILSEWSQNHHIDEVADSFGDDPAIIRLFTGGTSIGSDQRQRTTSDIARQIRHILERIAGSTPLVLVFDDLQWADHGTLELLHLVGPVTAHAAVTIVGTFRETEVLADHPLSAALALLQRTTKIDRVRLGPLGQDAIADAVQLLGGRRDRTRILIEQVAEETGGNALFVQEILLDLREQGILADPEAFDPSRLPDALRDIIHARVGRLSPQARSLLTAASLRPRGFDPKLVAQAVEMATADAFRAVEEAIQAGLIEERASRYGFTHDLIRQSLETELTAGHRTHLHGAFADLIEAEYDLSPATLSDLIYHHRRAGNAAARRRYLIEAGSHAEAAYAFLDAIDFYQQAATIDDPAASAGAVPAGLARSYAGAGYRLEAARHYLAAAEVEQDPTRARMLRTDAGVNLVRGGRVDEGRDLIVAAAREFGIRIPRSTVGIIAAIAAQQTRLGFARQATTDRLDSHRRMQLEFASIAYRGLRHADPLASALITSRYAVLAARSTDATHRAVAAIEQAVFNAVAGTNRSAKADRFAEVARTAARQADDPRVAATVELVEGTIAFMAGDFSETLQHDEAAAKLLNNLGGLEAAEQDVATLQHNASLYWLGRIADAEAYRMMQLNDAAARGDAIGRLNVGLNGVIRLLATDDPDMVATDVAEAERSWHQDRYGLHHTETLLIRTELELYQGHVEAALALLDQQARLMKRTMLLRAQYAAIMFYDGVVRAHLAAAAAGRRSHLASAGRAIARIRRQRAPWGDAIADLHEATAAALDDRRDAPAKAAEVANVKLQQLGLELWVAVAAYRIAQRRGDRPGMAEATASLSGLGVANPERTVAMFTPGWVS